MAAKSNPRDTSSTNGKTEGLISLIENLNKNASFSEALGFIFKSFAPFVPYNYIGVALVKNGSSSLEASFGISDGTIKGLPEGLMNKQYNLSGTSLENILKTGTVRVINDLKSYVKGRPAKEYNNIILKAGVRSSISLPLSINDKHIGIIFFSSNQKNIYTDEHVKFLKAVASSIAISFDKNIFVNNLLYSSILALAKLAEARDGETGDHIFRIGSYCELICHLLREDSKYKDAITPEYTFNIKRFSPMHDIGKVGVRDAVLLKPGKLTEAEFEEMKQHTIYGAKVLRAAEDNILYESGRSLFGLGIEIAENHHEKWDGTGYPYGKKGEEIPLSARIVAVADVFDALTSKRPYKEPLSFDESLKIIIEGSGSHFDPEIVRVIKQNKDRLFELYNSLKTPS
ncbi:MAG TPA: HD domain-containing protein [Clostridiales bacterium]|nr:HD domain-containing protein [Clostridiales bacterium]